MTPNHHYLLVMVISTTFLLLHQSPLTHSMPNAWSNSSSSTCENIYEVYDGDSCENIMLAFNLTIDILIESNPDLDCANLTLGQSVCLPSTPSITNITSNATAKAGSCAHYYTSEPDDTCELIAQAFRTDLTTLSELNPGLKCTTSLQPGQVLCVPLLFSTTTPSPPCHMLYLVYKDDTCETVTDAYKISKSQLKRLNPGLDCRKLPAGEKICVSGSLLDEPSTRTCDNRYTVYPGDSCANIAQAFRISRVQLLLLNSALNCDDLPVGQVVFVPCESSMDSKKQLADQLPQMPEYTDSCKSFYTIYDGDRCDFIAAEFQISLEFLLFLNPSLDCDNLPLGLRICIPQIGFNTPYPTIETPIWTTTISINYQVPEKSFQSDQIGSEYIVQSQPEITLNETTFTTEDDSSKDYGQIELQQYQFQTPVTLEPFQYMEKETTNLPPIVETLSYQDSPHIELTTTPIRESDPSSIQYQAPYLPPTQYQPPQMTPIDIVSSTPETPTTSSPSYENQQVEFYPPPPGPPPTPNPNEQVSQVVNVETATVTPPQPTPPMTTTIEYNPPNPAQTVPNTLTCEYLYTINTDDSCDSISGAFKISTDTLLELNPGLTCHYLSIGERFQLIFLIKYRVIILY